jgi:hypothetical protein
MTNPLSTYFQIDRNCRIVACQVLLVSPRRRAEVGREGEPVHASEVPGEDEQLHQERLCRGRRLSGNGFEIEKERGSNPTLALKLTRYKSFDQEKITVLRP